MIISIHKGINEGVKPKDLKSSPAFGFNYPAHSHVNLKDTFVKTNNNNTQTNIASLKTKVCSFLGAILKPDNTVSIEDQVVNVVNNFTDKVIALDKTRVNVQNIQDLVNICLPGSEVKVKDMSEFNNRGETNTYAAYEVTTDDKKNLYVNFDEDVTDKQHYANLIEALVHEFTHAAQRNFNNQLGRLQTIIKQRGMLDTLNSTFFQLELDLFRYNNSMKQYIPKKEVAKHSTEELFNYLKTTREGLNNIYQEILLNSLITRVNVDRKLATEFFISELKDEAQAYKLSLSSEKKVMGSENKLYNHELFHVLLSDMANHLTKRYTYEPIFVDKSDNKYSEMANLFVDIETAFGKDTILKHFKELEQTEVLEKNESELSVFDIFKDFSRESLNNFYETIISDNLSKYNKKPSPELRKALKENITEVAIIVKRHLNKIKEKYDMGETLYNVDYIPLLYQDFANYLTKQQTN